MGTNGNGDGSSSDGDPPQEGRGGSELPALPEGVVVPDDVSDLADEVERVRAELAPPELALPATEGPGTGRRPAMPAGPVLVIISFAVVITLVSLFAMVWSPPAGPGTATDVTPPLPDVVLTDRAGRATDVAALAPAVLLFVERCRCDRVVRDTARLAAPDVAVILISDSAPEPPSDLAASVTLRSLADPDGTLRATLELGAPPVEAATVVIAGRDGVEHVSPSADSVAPYRAPLANLGS